MENIREARCFSKTKHKLLAPLYLPLLLVNVYGRKWGVGNFKFDREQLYQRAKERDQGLGLAMGRCNHTFSDPANFASGGGRVSILDYGEDGMEDLLSRYGGEVEELLLSVMEE